MGNSRSRTAAPPPPSTTVPPTDEQVDVIYKALRDVYVGLVGAYDQVAGATAAGSSSSSSSSSSSGTTTLDRALLLRRLLVKLNDDSTKESSSTTATTTATTTTTAISAFRPPFVASNVTECIHETPLVEIWPASSTSAQVVAKLEYLSPGGSVKDRIALGMVLDAENRNLIERGKTTIVDLTSGNTGIGLGIVCASLGYDCVQVMPEPFSVERRAVMMALGVHVVVTPASAGLSGALQKYASVLQELGPDGWSPRQFDNPANVASHFQHTGPEIWEQCDGSVDAVVAAYGTGGTLSGTAAYLRSKNPGLLAIAVEPLESSLLSGDAPGPHGIQGISPPFVPRNVRTELLDQVVRVSTAEAMDASRLLARTKGILCGISAGANACAALRVAQRPDMVGKRIVTVLPSGAERYLSTALYADVMERARHLEMADVDDTVVVEGIEMRTRQSLEAAGLIKPGFQVY
jgi:cysteine synthase